MLWDLVNEGSQLKDEEKEELYQVLLEYEDAFASNSEDFGCTEETTHMTDTGDAHPIKQSIPPPPHRREEARRLLKDMLAKDVISPSKSPWASPIVLVKKKDGSLRFCVNHRKVNEVSRKDTYPIPRVDDTLDVIAGTQWFSTLDLISGYWQVEVDKKDRAFCTLDGLFEFNVMPFGLSNAPGWCWLGFSGPPVLPGMKIAV